MKEILKQRGKTILLGNEAIVRGALESGVNFASTYPGTPASEIGDTFSKIAKQAGIYFEYSTNEKVALEAALAASLSGLKSIVSMKHFGLNVASDSLIPSAYIQPINFVVVVADDPNCWSSTQSEQDSRYYPKIANIPMLEPSNSQECKDFTKKAFELSEKFKTPVLIRLTTRTSHVSSPVKLSKIPKRKPKAKFVKNYKKYYTMPPEILEIHKEILEKLDKIQNFFSTSDLNRIINNKGNFGVITSGVSFNYVLESLKDLNIKIPILKLGSIHPLPKKLIKKFLKNKKTILVVEELEPIIEEEICNLTNIKVYGKDIIPRYKELKPEIVENAITKLLNKKSKINFKTHLKKFKSIDIPRRFPVMCPGCPHRSTFYAVKSVAPNAIFSGDIGCYMLGIFPPYYTQDIILDMGASMGLSHGINKSTKQKTISFIGDSTFFHAGIPGLINMVFNKSNSLVIILDNRITAMTGLQTNPGVGKTGMNEVVKEIRVEEIAKACGVENVKVIDTSNIKEMKETVKKFLASNKLSVIVAKRSCKLLELREFKAKNITLKKFEIDQNKCTKCGICLNIYACPAIKFENNQYLIDKDLCNACGICAKVCPYKAIKVEK